jgi:hypothetical protein
VPTLAAYATMMERDRKREGLRLCRAAWLIGVSVREFREIVAGDHADTGHVPTDLQAVRVPQTFVGQVRNG